MAGLPQGHTSQAMVEPGHAATVAASPRRSGIRIHTFDALRHRGYLYIWIGILFTSAGVWMEQVALSWLVYEMTDSAFLLGATGGVRALPFLFVGPVAGVVADRFNRKHVLLWSQYAVLALYVVLVGLLWLDRIEVWHIFAFTILASVAWSFNQPVRQSLIPQLVPREDLANAIALQSVGFNVTRVVGPAVAGVLMATVGGTGTFLLVTFTWIGVIVVSHLIPVLPSEVAPRGLRAVDVWEDLIEGLRYIRTNEVVFGMILLAIIPIVFAMPYMTLIPIFARDVFGMDARGVGELLAASGVGAIVAALALASFRNLRERGKVFFVSGVALGVSIVLFGFSTSYPFSLAFMALVGLTSMVVMILANSVIQMATSQQYMGRVMSIYMLDRGLMPLGSFAAGVIAEVTSAPIALGLMGGICAVLVAIGALAAASIRRLG